VTIWVDGDSAPRDIRPILVRRNATVPVRFVSARKLPDVPGDLSILVPAGPDSADRYIEERAVAGDLVVTRDIPFAERLANLGIATLSDRGVLYTKENAASRRSLRDATAEMRLLGIMPPQPKGSHRTAKETKQFADGLDRALAVIRIS
jgi:uncharacterized protein YaiI (UPF0178 family)